MYDDIFCIMYPLQTLLFLIVLNLYHIEALLETVVELIQDFLVLRTLLIELVLCLEIAGGTVRNLGEQGLQGFGQCSIANTQFELPPEVNFNVNISMMSTPSTW